LLILRIVAPLAMVGCTSKAPPVALDPQPRFLLIATVQDLMDGQIDPAADGLWDSVAFIATEAGTEDRHPRTEAQWKAVRTNAVTLIEAANLLSMPGRRAAIADAPAGPGELRPMEIQQRMDSSHDGFVQLAHALQQAGMKALTAIDAKDPQALMDAGGVIDEACEACHVTYWYPNQQRPGN
jgi:cytochrome c556